MATPLRSIPTRLATMSLMEPGFIEQRFHEGVKLDRAGFEENRAVRHALAGSEPYVMLSIIPEEIDFELNIVSTDHFGAEEEIAGLTALAVVAHGQLVQGVTAIFFKYFPPQFPARIFSAEAPAREWLMEQRRK